MKSRTPVSLFPFLSVLLATMGVLSFLAVTFLLLSRQQEASDRKPEPVEVRWVGAPAHVRPMLVECARDGVRVHYRQGGPPRFFTFESLEREAEVVKEMLEQGAARFGELPSESRIWLYFKEAIPRERRLDNTLTRLMHDVEIDNLSGRGKRTETARYPIFLVYPDGIDAYERVSYLVESTTRLSVGVEPMLRGWSLPYQEQVGIPDIPEQPGSGGSPAVQANVVLAFPTAAPPAAALPAMPHPTIR